MANVRDGKQSRDTMFRCLQCGKHALLKCSVCKVARYCGKECQKSHWKAHKGACGPTDMDGKCAKRLIQKLSTLKFIGSDRFIALYAMSVRCMGALHIDITPEQCKEFVDGTLDISEHTVITSKLTDTKVPNSNIWLLIGNINYYVILNHPVMEQYADIRLLYGESPNMKLFAGMHVQNTVHQIYEQNYKGILDEIIKADGGIKSCVGNIIHTESYTFVTI